MSHPINHILHEFLTTLRILTEVARRLDMSSSTLTSQLNPKCDYAKFGLDDFERLCRAIREMGFGKELDSILHEYFEKLQHPEAEVDSSENLVALSAKLLKETAVLADNTIKLIDSSEAEQLREVKHMIRAELLPTSMRLLAIIDKHLSADRSDELTLPQST